jgi:hypothetical protein
LDDDDLRYEAISYAWGDPTDRKTMICNETVTSTTRSLFEALQRFRYVSTTRVLWADALCINQADNEERTAQVRLMSFIYSKAVRVLVWLQHEDDQVVQDALNAICRFVQKEDGFARFESEKPHTQQQSTQVFYQWRDVEVTSLSGEESPKIVDAAVDALRHICSSSWFGRGWVVQEAALSTSASVYWGHAEINFDWLGVALCSLVENRSSSFNQETLMGLCLYTMYLSTHNRGLSTTFLHLIYLISQFTFSEPRDRIYGLLGLKTIECDPADGQSFVDPDYSITTMECYRRVVGKLLSEWHDLRVLSMVCHGSEVDEDWPSWVPKFDQRYRYFFVSFDEKGRKEKEDASLVHISEIVIDEKQCIQISGFRVDTVDREVEECINLGGLRDDRRAPTQLQAMLRTLENAYSDQCLASTFGNWHWYLPLDSDREAMLLSEYSAFMNRDFVRDNHSPTLVRYWQLGKELSSFEPSADRFFRKCLLDINGRTLFITNTEMLGLGPTFMLPGDVVVVLHGADVPFVLRPADNGLWRLMGTCYLYDVNNGRCHREWEEKGSVSEKFCIC